MALPPRFQGLDVFWQLIKPQVLNRHEAALALTHWLLVGSGYRCVGHETELSLDPSKTPSELLPSDWNERSAGYYSLLYTTANAPSASDLILLKFIPAASITDSAILGQILVSGGDNDVIPFEVNSFHIIPEQWQTYASPTSFPHFKTFVDTIDRDVVEKLRSKKRGEGAGVGAARPPPPAGSAEQPTRYIVPPVPAAPVPAVPNPFAPLAPPPLAEFVPPRGGIMPGALGSRDLDPFHGTGGNIFGPRDIYPGGLPGAGVGFPGRPYRYDPPGPPEFMPGHGGIHPFGDPMGTGAFPAPAGLFGVGPRIRGPRAPLRPFEPDPDHMRPPPGPGDDPDNMFM